MKAHAPPRHPAQRVQTIWAWLLNVPITSADLEGRRRSRLLSAVLLVLIPLTAIASIVVNWLTAPTQFDFSNYLDAIYAITALLVLYLINRTGHYVIAAWLLVITFLVGPYAAVVLDNSTDNLNQPFVNIVATSVLVASIFIPQRRGIIITTIAASIELILLPGLEFQIKTSITVVVAPLLTVWMVGAFTLLYESHRSQLETDRRQALQLALQQTESANQELTKANQAALEATRLMSESERRQAILIAGLRAVIGVADELVLIPDTQLLYRRAVELAREKLGIERCAIFLEENATELRGTYGTDMQGNTTDEHGAITKKVDALVTELSKLMPDEPHWVVQDAKQSFWKANNQITVGHGWIGCSLIRSSDRTLGIFFNDAAISKSAFDPLKQEIVAIFCSMLGNLLESRQMQLTLQMTEDRYRRLFDEIADTVLIYDLHGNILDVNAACVEHLGYTRDELLQMNAQDINQPGVETLFPVQAEVRPVSGKRSHAQGVHKTRSGRLIDMDINAMAISYDGQQAILAVCRDITEQKQVEQDLRELNQLKTDFLSTAAHELRTPLTSLVGFSELLVTREMDQTRSKHFLKIIHDQSVSLYQIVDSLLDISRLETKQALSLNIQPVNIGDLVIETRANFAELGDAYQINIEGLENCPEILCDRFRLGQVLQNLLSNAIKFSPGGGLIIVRGVPLNGYLRISVQDHGIGMTKQQQIHLFERFYRADTSNTTISGTGLGLSICKLIIELHGGRIWVDSEHKVGTTMYFELPFSNKLS